MSPYLLYEFPRARGIPGPTVAIATVFAAALVALGVETYDRELATAVDRSMVATLFGSFTLPATSVQELRDGVVFEAVAYGLYAVAATMRASER